jgi:hypothetical protein
MHSFTFNISISGSRRKVQGTLKPHSFCVPVYPTRSVGDEAFVVAFLYPSCLPRTHSCC